MRRAVITGATGAVGTALIRELLDHNVELLIFCHKDSGRNGRIPEHPLIEKIECSLEQL